MISRANKIKGIFAKAKADLKSEIIPCLNVNCNTGGFYSVPLIIFSFIEYLGILWKNPVEKYRNKRKSYYSKSQVEKAAIPYIKKYLGKVRPEYKKYSGLLYGLFRHSLVHHFQPNVIILNNKDKLSWGIIKNSTKNHLTISKEKFTAPNGYLINHFTLNINIDIFFQDLIKSVHEFENDALKYKSVRQNILRAEKKLNKSQPENSLLGYVKNDLKNI